MFETILVSLDGSPDSETVLPIVEKIVSCSPAKVILLRVAPEVNYTNVVRDYDADTDPELRAVASDLDVLYTEKERELEAYLRPIGANLKKAGAISVIFEYSFNDPVMEILHSVKRHHIKLIMMATHGRQGLDRLMHGSITEAVLHQAPCPMLIVRAPTAAQAVEDSPSWTQVLKD